MSLTKLRRVAAATIVLTAVSLGCADKQSVVSGMAPSGATAIKSASTDTAQTTIQFTVGPLAISGIDMSFPGGNWHLRSVLLNGLVAGELSGNADMTINANLDEILGSGPAWGDLTIVTTSGDTWQGTFTGRFESGAPLGIQLFSRVVLHGPGQQIIQADCNETSVTSETLACTGEILGSQRQGSE